MPRRKSANFGGCSRILKHHASFSAAESVCRASRRLRYAIREEPCSLEGATARVHEHWAKALALLEEALTLRTLALAAVGQRQQAKVKRFFVNIAKRKNDLARETA